MRAAYDAFIAGGGKLVAAPDGPLLDHFSAFEMAQAIESEVRRAPGLGWDHVSMKMTLEDASRLAAYLRRAVAAGV
jgi:hypothetical protein